MPRNPATLAGHVLALVLPSLLVAFLALPAAPAAAAVPIAYTGLASGCEYEVTFDVDDRTFAGKVKKECKLEGAIFRGDYEKEAATLTSTEGKVSPFEHDVDMEASPDWAFTVPVPGTTLEALLERIGAGEEPKAAGQATVEELMESVVSDLYGVLTEKLELQAGGWVESVLEKQEKVEDTAREYCGEAEELDPFCEDSAPKTTTLKPGTESELESEQAALCPVNMAQKAVIFVCLPSFVQGDFSAGKKPIVLLPGGMLIALPIGGTNLFDLSATPTISSQQAIASLGGVIVGFNLRLKAPDLALSAGIVDMAGSLSLEGENVNVGAVDLQDVLGTLPVELLNNKYYKNYQEVAQAINMPDPITESGTLSTPIWVGARQIEAKPSEAFQLGAISTLSTSGRGGAGGTPADAAGGLPEGEAPGPEEELGNGAKADFGGSHGGYGAYPETPADWQAWGLWQTMEGRGAIFDSPFTPSLPGAGGSGNSSDSVDRGADGGGVVRIDAPRASVQLQGTIDASGEGAGYSPEGNPYTPDGAGAGGSVYVTAKSLSGTGRIDADGGGYAPGSFNSDGGSGGGGRIALLYGDGSGWSGSADAHGGVDQQFTGLEDEGGWPWYFRGTGGAGTVFTQQVVFNDVGTVKEGKGEFTEGTLMIDGGLPAGHYPPPDGTPIADSWGGPHRRLVLSGEARGYGSHPNFGTIEVLGGSDLTGEIGSRRLEVSAGTLKVDAASRVDMTGRGYEGGSSGGFYDEPGNVDAGETAPGYLPATRDYGGSHGGAGGSRATTSGFLHPEEGDVPGATYDDPLEPSLPGGGGAGESDTGVGNPGGGVLDVTAGSLLLDGQLSADGESGNGPTAADPTPFVHEGAAGAGGSVLVRAETLSGSGVVHADGGWACLPEPGPPLLPHGGPCSSGDGGGGGGGRVAVYAAECGWGGSLRAAGGVNQEASREAAEDPEDEGLTESAANATGGDGSTYLATSDGSCGTGGGSDGGGAGSGDGGGGGATGPGGPSPTAPTDRTAPGLSRLRMGRGVLSLAVSEPGTLEVKLSRCVAKRVHRRRVTVCKAVRTITVRVTRPGQVHVALPAGLRPGRYEVTVRARDAAGNVSGTISRRFVAKGKRHGRRHPAEGGGAKGMR